MEGFSQNNEKAYSIMMKMGYKQGSGLGKDESGMLQPIQVNIKNDKTGFGHDLIKDISSYEVWHGDDKVAIVEDLIWVSSDELLISNNFSSLTYEDLIKFIVRGTPLTTLEDEIHFCDPNALKNVLKTKEDIFLNLDGIELSKARQRANQFETIKSAFFMNRAALKMANIDAATGFMFTNIDKDINHQTAVGPYYFADVCAGPGGFSEYILWRKKWGFKGFGFTLKGVHDFKMYNSTCASDVTFRGYYGSVNDGNACNPSNIADFTKKVFHETGNKGVHFMMSDGGFSVEGKEGIQEILSKQIYICQCLIALEIVRKHGHFVTKLFDTFTAFSVGLMFLMYQCFEKVSVLKPNSSRPANSERYFICRSLKDAPIVKEVRKYLRKIVLELWNIHEIRKESTIDILNIVAVETIKGDSIFYNYIKSQNTKLAQIQTRSLCKLAAFCKNPGLVDEKQEQLRTKCLEYWNIPNIPRAQVEKLTTDDLINLVVNKPELIVSSNQITNIKELEKHVTDVYDWIYVPLSSTRDFNSTHIFVGTGGNSAYKFFNHKWSKVKGLKLIKGTLLFGEIVTELSSQIETRDKVEVKALHVIDALRLGDVSLADLNHEERNLLIQTYCKAVNFETVEGQQFRIRPKLSDKLSNIHEKPLITYCFIRSALYTLLPTLGLGVLREFFLVNSVLLLKTGYNHYFKTSYVLRAQVFIGKTIDAVEDKNGLHYETLVEYVKTKS